MQRDDDWMAKLSSKLTEEIGNLPNDGRDHELIIKIKGNHGNINLGTQTFDIQEGKQPPPPGSDRERECPQCSKPAWRYTKLCMHCDYDLQRHDEIEADAEQERRKEASALRMLKAFVACAAVAAGAFFLKDYLPDAFQNWAIAVTAVAGFFAFVLLQGQR